MKINKIHLENHPLFGTMDIDFTEPDGKTLDTIVIAGINGTGKTTLLETIFEIGTNSSARNIYTDSYLDIDLTYLYKKRTIDSHYNASFLDDGRRKINLINDIPSYLATTINNEVYKYSDLPAKQAIEKVCDGINSLFDILEMDARMVGLNPEGEKLPIFKKSI